MAKDFGKIKNGKKFKETFKKIDDRFNKIIGDGSKGKNPFKIEHGKFK